MIFVVGPSRGGKTTLPRAALPEFPSFRLLDLDEDETRRVNLLVAEGKDSGGWDSRWERNLEALSEAAPGTVVDVGAGSLQTEQGRAFLVDRGRSAIAVVASWEVVHSRHPGRSAVEFQNTEYSIHRQRVYDAARFRIDSSRDLAQSLEEMRMALRDLANGAA